MHLPSRKSSSNTVYVKSVKTCLSVDVIKSDISNSLNSDCFITRLLNRITKHPLPVIKITFNDRESAQLCLRNGNYILGNHFQCHPKRIYKVVRCFNCQQFGHIAKACLNAPRCVQCCKWNYSDDSYQLLCYNPPCCANCNSSHRADSHFCPKFTSLLKQLIKP